ncbi:MAG: dTDP-4-dehydrorhamnose reductase [Planctomycetes bacterium]|nr:dTDP-4-dehydrorhamnose reductase [Planctomycetota bacterium]MCB9869484.1 dTDP-4-dehydrorhamnose reductase [Planctomycetota bacterium]
MRFLVTGALGQLGRVACEAVAARGWQAIATDVPEVPVDDFDALAAVFGREQPTHVLHCGAITNVDGCEADPDTANRVNGTGTAHVARLAEQHGAALVYVSTDFVFDGKGTRPYRPEDPPGPISAYGVSKLLGERAVLERGCAAFYVTRTAWVFGPGGKNFPRAILDRARSGQPLRVVDDQIGCPSMTRDLAEAMLDLITSGAPGGIYHMANEGSCSWHRFACQILQAAAIDVPVGTMSSAELGRPAPRPAYSVLDCSKLTAVRGKPLPHYEDALRRYLQEELS